MPHGVHVNSKVVALRLPLELAAYIQQRAEAQGLSVNAFVRELLTRWSRRQSMEVSDGNGQNLPEGPGDVPGTQN